MFFDFGGAIGYEWSRRVVEVEKRDFIPLDAPLLDYFVGRMEVRGTGHPVRWCAGCRSATP